MVRDAESHAEDDRRRREEAEIRNDADSRVYATEKLLREDTDGAESAARHAVEERLAALRSALQVDGAEARECLARLDEALHTYTSRLYQGAARHDHSSAPGNGNEDDEVVEGELVEDAEVND